MGDPQPMPPGLNPAGGFGIMGTANDTTVSQFEVEAENSKIFFQVEREELIYP